MFEWQNVFILAEKELRDARRNRWFLLYTVAFTALSLALAWLALAGAGNYGLAGFGRTSASLINLILLIVPLMGLTLGAMALAGEREQKTLLYLLAQPVSQAELLLGKFLGLGLALIAALSLGFGLSALPIAFAGDGAQVGVYVQLLALGSLLAVASLSVGIFVSALTRSGSTAVGVSLFLWLALAFFGDLGLMGSALAMELDIGALFALSLLNPLQLFKIASVYTLRQSLETLGPAGIYALRTYGGALLPLLVALLMAWVVAPLLGAGFVFRRKGVL